jgi:DNA repair protein RadD
MERGQSVLLYGSYIYDPPMTLSLRPFQTRACKATWLALQRVRSVCLVAPTGAGKTVMGTSVVAAHCRRSLRTLWVAHRTELITQSAAKLRESTIGKHAIGIIAPHHPSTPSLPVQVASIQTLTSRGFPPNVDFVVLDECHHYRADDWGQVHTVYPDAKFLGLTATPQRRDGRALGDMFDELIVAAQHSELLADGYLVPCDVYQPERGMGSNEVAQDPLLAYQSLANGQRCFVFAGRVEQCEILAQRFNEAGIHAAVIEANTPKCDRDFRLKEFRAGRIKVLCNVYALTEGVDVPEASCVIIARKMDHVGMYLQCCGRVLRPAPGKTNATIVDLVGVTLKPEIGSPTEDRTYSLEGDAIHRDSPEQLRVCPACGLTTAAWRSSCPECGFVPPIVEAPKLKIFSQELRRVFAGMQTPDNAKRSEYLRLREEGRKRGWNLYFVQKEYAKLFGEKPVIDDASDEEKHTALAVLRATAQEKGYSPNWASVRFKRTFGRYPR